MLAPHTIIHGYEILSVLGTGGFGIIYKAKHPSLGIDVALKEFFPVELCIRQNGIVQPSKEEFRESFQESLDRFIKEARQLENFRECPNIVTCRDLFNTNGTAYIVMDYIHGVPLSILLEQREKQGNPFTENDMLQVVLPVLNGLQLVHDAGVCHRDIKPSNIIIRRADSVPVLIDFGAAKHEINRHTKSFAPYSDGYAALEQVGEGDIGPWTDIYGVGALMWRMVAGGNPPFSPPIPVTSQKRAFELMYGREDPLPSAKLVGHSRFNEEILQSIDDCLVVNLRNRIQNCNELLNEIRPRFSQELNPPLKEKTSSDQQENYHVQSSDTESLYRQIDQIKLIETESFSASSYIYDLGVKYAHGQGVEKNDEIASNLFLQAANLGHVEAQYEIGNRFLDGAGINKDEQEAVKWLKLAADDGHLDALFSLAQRYFKGQGTLRNDREGFRCVKIAAIHGHIDSQYFLGNHSKKRQAVKWYRKAAEQGHADSQFELGICYFNGTGVTKNNSKAAEWLKMASDRGHKNARKRLEFVFRSGVTRFDYKGILLRLLRLFLGSGLAIGSLLLLLSYTPGFNSDFLSFLFPYALAVFMVFWWGLWLIVTTFQRVKFNIVIIMIIIFLSINASLYIFINHLSP
ncbi:MAG: serine/threonine-protein kinase [Bacteroidetes bacterium]|nr:serine/threonine-protein kinase [Bacteroidota bacterium]